MGKRGRGREAGKGIKGKGEGKGERGNKGKAALRRKGSNTHFYTQIAAVAPDSNHKVGSGSDIRPSLLNTPNPSTTLH